MNQSVGEIRGKVISIAPITNFEGEAISAHFDPRYVVAFLLDNSKQNYLVHGSDVAFPSYQVALFAIHSVTELFQASDFEVIGRSYRLKVAMETTDDKRRYRLEPHQT